MRALGLNVGGDTLRLAVLEGTLSAPVLVERERLPYDTGLSLIDRMSWYRNQFDQILDRFRVDRIAYRMHMGRGMTQEQIATFHYPWGVLLSCCARLRIEPLEMTGSSLTAKRFDLAKGLKPMIEVDMLLGKHPPNWDDAQRYAACAAWGALE